MNDVLSQAEIDKLLNELIAGEAVEPVKEDKEVVKKYDFRALTFHREQIRNRVIYKDFGLLLSNYQNPESKL